MREITSAVAATMVGCWLDGVYGWRNNWRCIQLAREYGYTPSVSDWEILTVYFHTEEPPAEILDQVEEVVSNATEYLDSCVPEGYMVMWDNGDLVMMHVEDESSPFFGMDVE